MAVQTRLAVLFLVFVLLIAGCDERKYAVKQVCFNGTVPPTLDLWVATTYVSFATRPGVYFDKSAAPHVTSHSDTTNSSDAVPVGADGRFSCMIPTVKKVPDLGECRLQNACLRVVRREKGGVAPLTFRFTQNAMPSVSARDIDLYLGAHRRGEGPYIVVVRGPETHVTPVPADQITMTYRIADRTDDASTQSFRDRILRALEGEDVSERAWAMEMAPGFAGDMEMEPRVALGLVRVLKTTQGKQAALVLHGLTHQEFCWAGVDTLRPGYTSALPGTPLPEPPSRCGMTEEKLRAKEAAMPAELDRDRAVMEKQGRSPKEIADTLARNKAAFERYALDQRAMLRREQLGYWAQVVPVDRAEEWVKAYYGIAEK